MCALYIETHFLRRPIKLYTCVYNYDNAIHYQDKKYHFAIKQHLYLYAFIISAFINIWSALASPGSGTRDLVWYNKYKQRFDARKTFSELFISWSDLEFLKLMSLMQLKHRERHKAQTKQWSWNEEKFGWRA